MVKNRQLPMFKTPRRRVIPTKRVKPRGRQRVETRGAATQTTPKRARPLPTFIRPLRDLVRSGVKTQTRRVVKPQPPRLDPEPELPLSVRSLDSLTNTRSWPLQTADGAPGFPYGQVGDLLYLREPLKRGPKRTTLYADDGAVVMVKGKPLRWRWKNKTLPSVFMPRRVARMFVVLRIRKARWLHNATAEDCKAEGCEQLETSFAILWDSINLKTYPWIKDPLVWVIGWEPFVEPTTP